MRLTLGAILPARDAGVDSGGAGVILFVGEFGMPLGAGPTQYVQAFTRQWAAGMSGGLSVPFALAAIYLGDGWQGTLTAILAALCFVMASYFIWAAERRRVMELEAERDALVPPVETEFSQPEDGQWRLTITNVSDRQIENCQVLLRSLTELLTGRAVQLGEAFVEVSDGATRFSIPRRGNATVIIMGLTALRDQPDERWLKIGGDRGRNIQAIATVGAHAPVRLDIQIQATDLNPQALTFEHKPPDGVP